MAMSLRAQEEVELMNLALGDQEEEEEKVDPVEKVLSVPELMDKILSYCADLHPISLYRLRLVSSYFNEGVLRLRNSSNMPPFLKVSRWSNPQTLTTPCLGLGFEYLSKEKLKGQVDQRLYRRLAVDFSLPSALKNMTETLTMHGSSVVHLKLTNLRQKHVLPAIEVLTQNCPNLKHLRLAQIGSEKRVPKPVKKKSCKVLEKMVSLNISASQTYIKLFKSYIPPLGYSALHTFGELIDALPNLQIFWMSDIEADYETMSRLPISLLAMIGDGTVAFAWMDNAVWPLPSSGNLRHLTAALWDPSEEFFYTIFENMVSLDKLHLDFHHLEGTISFFNCVSQAIENGSRRCDSVSVLRLDGYITSGVPQLSNPDVMRELQEMFPNLTTIQLDVLHASADPGDDVDPLVLEAFANLQHWKGLKDVDIHFYWKILSVRHLLQLVEAFGMDLFTNGLRKLEFRGVSVRDFGGEKEFTLEDGTLQRMTEVLLWMKKARVVVFDNVMFPLGSDLRDSLRAFIQDNQLPVHYTSL